MPSSASQLDDPMPSVDANSSYVFGNTSPEYSNSTKVNGSTASQPGGTGLSQTETEETVYDGSDVQLFSENGLALQDDPHCNSSGCTQYLFPKSEEEKKIPRDYFVPNFGVDHDILASERDLKVAEKNLDTKWIFATPESRE